MEYKDSQFEEESINLGVIVSWIIKKWYFFLISLPICLVFGVFYLKVANPVYKVSTSILIDDESSGSLNAEDFFSEMGIIDNKENIENEIGILKSNSLLKRTIQILDFDVSYFSDNNFLSKEIYQKSPFTVIPVNKKQVFNRPFYLNFISNKKIEISFSEDDFFSEDKEGSTLVESFEFRDTIFLGQAISSKYFNFKIEENPNVPSKEGSSYFFIFNEINSLVRKYQSKLEIVPISTGSSIIELEVQGTIINKEKNFLNTLCNTYIDYQLERKNRVAINTIDFIDKQLIQITDSLQGAENELKNFRQTNKTVNLSTTAQNASEQLKSLDSEKSALNLKIEYYEFLLNYLLDKNYSSIIAPASIGIEDPILNASILELKNLNSTRVELLYSLSPESKEIKVLDLKMENQKQNLIENVKNILSTLNITKNELESRINTYTNIIRKLPEDEQNLVQIQRKFEFSDNLYNYLLQKKAEAGIAKASSMPDNQMLDSAYLKSKKPTSPNNLYILSVCFIIGLLLPLSLILIIELSNDKINDLETIENSTPYPVISTITKQNNINFSVVKSLRSGIAESFRDLRLNLDYIAPEKSNKVIGFTSTISGEGKTFCSINLASILAISNKRTIIIGADLRKPKLVDYLLSNSIISNTNGNHKGKRNGLSNYLINKSDIDDIIYNSDIDNLDFIPSGKTPPNPVELLESLKMNSLIDYLKGMYDYIIIDAPPIGLVTDYYILERLIDINIYVLRFNYSKKAFLKNINRIHHSNRFKNLSLIFNGVEKSKTYGYGGYGYGYYNEDDEKSTSLLKKINFKDIKIPKSQSDL